jgi:toxin ParE1/3/4
LKIFWSPLAAERLEDIFKYISTENSNAAYKMIERIFKRVETISKFPKRGRKLPEANREEIRELFESGYRIIYRVESNRIYVLSIRNFKQLLSKKDLE